MEGSDITHLSEELIQRLGNGMDLEGIISSDLFQQGDLYIATNQDDTTTSMALDNEIIMHMDIREPLKTLQKLLEKKLGVSLHGYEFWLQDAQELEPHKNLVDQCVKGEGLVQINVEIKYIIKRINILDVLKPTEDALAALNAVENRQGYKTDSSSSEEDDEDLPRRKQPKHLEDTEGESKAKKFKSEKSSSSSNKKERPCLNWVLDSKFRKEQLRLKIPENPHDWTYPHVKYWFQWAVAEFNLTNFKNSDWNITGRQLCSLTHEEFRKKLPTDPGDVLWTHIQLLKECKFVAVVHKVAENELIENKSNLLKDTTSNISSVLPREQKIMRKTSQYAKRGAQYVIDPLPIPDTHVSHAGGAGMGSGNNGQVQLWQFLLEILTDREHANIIQWVGEDGEFKLTDAERVARLWGEKKNKPAMNYEKLSRALRYYYDGDMISKVSGKRFTYKFDCDLKLLIGYTASELSVLVNEKPSHVSEQVNDNKDSK